METLLARQPKPGSLREWEYSIGSDWDGDTLSEVLEADFKFSWEYSIGSDWDGDNT